MRQTRFAIPMLAFLLCATSALAGPPVRAPAPSHTEARDMLAHVVGIPTVAGRDKGEEMARAVADRFKSAGWPESDIKLLPYDKTAALVVRWPGMVKNAPLKGVMLMAHMDVVEARREDWTTDPFVLTEKDGYYYGRGAVDNKLGVVSVTQALINLRRAGFKPQRDIVVFFTGDEETGGRGAELGATEWKEIIGPLEYGLNADAGGIGYDAEGKALGASVQTSEKTYTNYIFTVRNKGGHSSKPRKDNAIYQLAKALDRLENHRFEPMMNETTRAYFAAREKLESGPLGDAMRRWLANPKAGEAADIIEADERETGLTRTRCVATQLEAGHAKNALPQIARANINCRLFPGVSPDAMREELERVVADPQVAITRDDDYRSSAASPLRPDVMRAYTAAVCALHPNMSVSPQMSTGATDARPFREAGIPVYGIGGGWLRLPEDQRIHGKDERLPVQALDDAVRHMETMIRQMTGK